MDNKVEVLAFYLPQFHPLKENDLWWGKGFTEWTNVGRAKPLFRGHYQPHIPADLGYYDLRIPEIREEQARLAKNAGITGFVYWHYWLGNGKTIMDMPYRELLKTLKPDFPFSLCWANHSWYAKNWNSKGTKGADKLLMEQLYPGKEDYKKHFEYVLPAFKDSRYTKVGNKPIFGIYEPLSIPNVNEFVDLWNRLAQVEGFDGVYFFAFSSRISYYETLKKYPYDGIILDLLADSRTPNRVFLRKLHLNFRKRILKMPEVVNYSTYTKFASKIFANTNDAYPCIEPNYDHSPRSGNAALILHDSTPDKWEKLLLSVKDSVLKSDREKIIFIKAWNEWAEGNHLEPDLKFGNAYLDAIKKVML